MTEIQNNKGTQCAVVMATCGRLDMLRQVSLPSVRRQTLAPLMVVLVMDGCEMPPAEAAEFGCEHLVAATHAPFAFTHPILGNKTSTHLTGSAIWWHRDACRPYNLKTGHWLARPTTGVTNSDTNQSSF